jgi:hypothetical protein
VTAPTPLSATGTPVDMTKPDHTYGTTPWGGLSAVSTIALPLVELSADEKDLVTRLDSLIQSKRFRLELRDAYYRGVNRIQDLGISIPPSMRNLKVALGWPRVAVESLALRLNIDGFMFPDSSDVDERLQEIWLGNDMDAEHSLANLDALVFGAGFVAAGSPATGPNVIDAPPLITVESPLDIGVEWDARTRQMTAALRIFGFEGSKQGTLYLPNQTVSLLVGDNGWEVLDRDVHNLGMVPLERIANRGRSYARDGASEITPELMSLTDMGSRTLLGLAVASEFYSAPQRYILGADESAFVGPDGTTKSGWETYLGRVIGIGRDGDGNVPTAGTFQAYDPSVYTKVLDSLAQRISAITGIPPHALGFATANPTSADAIRSAEMELTRRADQKTTVLGKPWRNIMKKALMLAGGPLPPKLEQLAAIWSSTATPTIGATTDAMFKQVTMGYLPATSDVVGERLGYTAAERRRIEADRATDAGMSFLNELAHSIGAKDARVDMGLATDIGGKQVGAPTAKPPLTAYAKPDGTVGTTPNANPTK